MKLTPNPLYWKICCAIAVLLAILTFTPVITPAHRYTPMLLGLPYTLWTGILLGVTLILLTLVATRVHPGREKGTEL